MTNRPRVAVIADTRRQDAVAQALYLLGDAWPAVPASGTVLKPNLVSHTDLRASTHPITLGAVADFLYLRGASEITIAEGASDATAGFANLGHQRMFWKRPVRWFDINRDENQWQPISLRATNGSLRNARLSQTMATAPLFVSVAQAKTHVNTMLTASMKNLMSCMHPADRINMHGYASGNNGHPGIKGKVVNWLKGESMAVALATTLIGRCKQAGLLMRQITGQLQWQCLSSSQREFCRSIAALHTNLVTLNQAVGPKLAVVDGFSAMDGEGPRLGRSRNLGWVVAGNDPVAVDAVVATLMGMKIDHIGYLMLADQAGLGVARLNAIEVVGDSIESLTKRCRLHSHAPLQQFWPQALAEMGEGMSAGKAAPNGKLLSQNQLRDQPTGHRPKGQGKKKRNRSKR
jgi:uncharacterized protein (DUF362 family)